MRNDFRRYRPQPVFKPSTGWNADTIKRRIANIHAWLAIACSVVALLLGIPFVDHVPAEQKFAASNFIPAALFALLAIAHIAASKALHSNKHWATKFSLVLAILMLPGVPVGTGAGIILLLNLNRLK